MALKRLIGSALALALMTVPSLAVTLTGTVTYRERIALPAGATLRVTLVDLASGANVVGASTRIPHQVPVGFSLDVRSALGVDTAYGLVAEIAGSGALIFRSTAPIPVDVSSPEPVHLVVRHSPAPPSEPAADIPTPPEGLVDVLWTVTSIGGRPALGQRPLTLSVAPDMRVGGNGGCNNYFTEALLEADGAITFGPAAATRMACAAEVMAQETAYFAALAAVTSFEIEGKALRLLDPAGVPLVGLIIGE